MSHAGSRGPATSSSATSSPAAGASSLTAAASQHAQPPPPAVDSETSKKMTAVLNKNFLGVFKLAVRQVKTTEYTRQINGIGLNSVKESIIARGWDSTHTPYVLVPLEQIPSGTSTVFTEEVLGKLVVYCLDGNHRLVALLHLHGPDYMVECRLYLDYGCQETTNTLARNVNGMTGATAVTTTYDKIFSTIKAIQAIRASKGLSHDSEVTAPMLADASRKGGEVPPSNPQLCANKRLALGFSAEGFAALKAVFESEDPYIDTSCISKNLLDHPVVHTHLLKHPLEQALFIHILARFKKHNAKAPVKKGLEDLKKRAMAAGNLHRRVSSVVPLESWTPDLQSGFDKIVYGRLSDWEVYGWGHIVTVDEELANLESLLPKGRKLSKDQARIVTGKLPARLEKIADNNPDLRPHVEAWKQRRAGVSKFVEQNQNVDDSSSGSGSDEEEEDDEEDEEDEENEEEEENDKVILCEHCSPKKATGYRCPQCGVHHFAWCDRSVQPEEADSACKDRPCTECPTDQPPTKKHKKNSKPATPIVPSNTMETSMSRNTAIHPARLFAGNPRSYQGGDVLKVNKPPKLAVVDLTRETFLFKNTDASNSALKGVLSDVFEALHPQGTMAVACPRPWFGPGAIITGAFAHLRQAVVEEHPILITYETVAGGAVKKSHENHTRNQSEIVLLVHRSCPPDQPFTCNRRVVVTDVFGHSTGPYPHAKQILRLEALPAGAPNGGPRAIFPAAAAQYFVGRFTNADDTVLGIGVETTAVAEEAIEKGRRVEFFVLDEDKRVVLQNHIADAFRTAHGRGLFQSRRGQEVWVGPGVLPSGLPESTVPPRVVELLKETQAKMPGDSEGAFFKVAQMIAKDSNYDLKGEGDRISAELKPKKKRRGASRSTDIPVWGKLVVYTSPNEAKGSLEDEDRDEQFVRLIQIADNAQLRLMLEAESELCGVDAALYIRVDPTCPIYWVRWDNRKARADLEVACDIPHRGDRSTVLQRVQMNDDGKGGVVIRHARNTPTLASTPASLKPVLVSSECGRIVGSQEFGRGSSPGGDGSDGESEVGEEADEGGEGNADGEE